MSLEKKENIVEVFVLLVLLRGSGCWTIFAQRKKKLDAIVMWRLRIPWTEHVRNGKILRIKEAKRTFIIRIKKKRQWKLLMYIIWNGGVENLSVGKGS